MEKKGGRYLLRCIYLCKEIIIEMIRHFFLDKTNSIVENSKQNMGLNPVLHVGYGNRIMRGLLHFDTCEIKQLIEDKTFANLDKLKFTLKMTNYFSIDGVPYEKSLLHSSFMPSVRAGSFDLVLFKLPCEFDEGRGFDFLSDFWIRDNASFSNEGSSWYFAKSGIPWNDERNDDEQKKELTMPNIFDKRDFVAVYNKLIEFSKTSGLNKTVEWGEECKEVNSACTCDVEFLNGLIEDLKRIGENEFDYEKSLKGGIYSDEKLMDEYEKFLNGEESLIVATQHFDFGDENLSMDITDYVLECVKTGVNNGLCLAFSPFYEKRKTEIEQYVGFADDNTNTFFHPYVEADYSEYIEDDRESFTIGRKNRLYLYVSDNGEPANLDKMPVCTVGGIEVEAKQATKGVYYAEIDANDLELEPASIYYDTWSEIALNGQEEDDVELEFSTRPKSHKLKISSDSSIKKNMIPTMYGINDEEKIHQGEVREISVDFRKEYETDKKYLVDGAEYRLYSKDGNRDITIIDYRPIEKTFLNNFFIIYAGDLIPGRYYVDIKTKLGREVKYFREALRFRVVSDVTERYP